MKMRIWDLPPEILCDNHLLGEHRELHAIWSIYVNNKKGYLNHPETKRWKGKLLALYNRHDMLVEEMKKRNFNHLSELDKKLATGKSIQNDFLDSIDKQKSILKKKRCHCKI